MDELEALRATHPLLRGGRSRARRTSVLLLVVRLVAATLGVWAALAAGAGQDLPEERRAGGTAAVASEDRLGPGVYSLVSR